jgi:succinyl-diaminopimelate desuccinylase
VAGITPELSTAGGTSDGRFIADVCSEIAEFGPVNATIHKLNEHVALTDIAQLHNVYFSALENLLIKPTTSVQKSFKIISENA